MTEQSQPKKTDVAAIGERWKGWGTIGGAIVALLVLILGGGFFYNEIWQSKILSYTILPTYDLGNQAFTGLVVENRGRVNLTDVQITIGGLPSPIQSLNMPEPHEPARVADGGVDEKRVRIEMPRLSQGYSLAVYMLMSGTVSLQGKQQVLVSSKETVGTSGTSQSPDIFFSVFGIVSTLMSAIFAIYMVLNLRSSTIQSKKVAP